MGNRPRWNQWTDDCGECVFLNTAEVLQIDSNMRVWAVFPRNIFLFHQQVIGTKNSSNNSKQVLAQQLRNPRDVIFARYLPLNSRVTLKLEVGVT